MPISAVYTVLALSIHDAVRAAHRLGLWWKDMGFGGVLIVAGSWTLLVSQREREQLHWAGFNVGLGKMRQGAWTSIDAISDTLTCLDETRPPSG